MDRGPTCDFCEIAIEEDEDELVELHVGGDSQPTTITLREVLDNPNGKMRTKFPGTSPGGVQVLGYSEGSIISLIRFMEKRDEISLEIHEGVNELQRTGGGFGDYETVHNTDKTVVDLSIMDAKDEDPPDAEVCTDCAEMFRSL